MRRILLVAAIAIIGALPGIPAQAASRLEDEGHLRSFDGTLIAYSFFAPAKRPAPVVFYTHGWGGRRERADAGWVARLLDNGYAVLTWDARGFGDSGGAANVDSQEFEVKDVQRLIAYAASRPEVLQDAPGDPRMGMSGGSYAGGIQLMTASVDRRVDAIVPEIAWHDLVQSLLPNGVVKLGWGALLYGAGNATGTAEGLDSRSGPQTGALAVQIHRAFAESTALNTWSDETIEWFDARSPKHYLKTLRAPTLIAQGVSDTLFNGTQGIQNFETIRSNGVPAKLLLFCGGHTVNAAGTSCREAPDTGISAGEMIDRAALAWFDRYLRGNEKADTGATVDYQLQDGTFASLPELPRTTASSAASRTGRGEGRVAHAVAPTSGVVTAPQPSREGLRIPVNVPAGATVLGVPRVSISASGTGTEASLFLKLLDVDESGKAVVVDDQATALKLTGLGDAPVKRSLDLAAVSWKLQPGHTLQLEVAPSSNDHSSSRVPFVVDVTASITVPVVSAAQVRGARVARPAPAAREPLPATGVAPLVTWSLLSLTAAFAGARKLRRAA